MSTPIMTYNLLKMIESRSINENNTNELGKSSTLNQCKQVLPRLVVTYLMYDFT